MQECPGNGECLRQCGCECSTHNERTNIEMVNSHDEKCEHYSHELYCPSECRFQCVPIECKYYELCNNKEPLWVINYNEGMCMKCVNRMGPHEITSQIKDCCVCYEKKKIIILQCKHDICDECWYIITENYPPSCPICRNENVW